VFPALLDTNILWPNLQRDFLLSLAAEGLYRPLWSEDILAELRWSQVAKQVQAGADIGEAEDAAARLDAAMRHAFPDALVEGYEPLIGTYGLPDPDDEHVVAAAVVGGAGVIVTHNLKDFSSELLPPPLIAIDPIAFVEQTVEIDPQRAQQAISEMAHRSGRRGPPLSAQDILEVLDRRYGMERAMEYLRTPEAEGSE